MKDVLKFGEITAIMIILLNNKKYNADTLVRQKEFDYFTFLEDFSENMNTNDKMEISLLPQLIIRNLVYNNIFMR